MSIPHLARAVLPLAALALVAACGGGAGVGNGSTGSGDTGGAPTSSAPNAAYGYGYAQSTDSAGGSQVATAGTRQVGELGTILVDGQGVTLYLFEKDSTGNSTCYDACARVWPPLLTSAAPNVDGQAKGSLLGTVTRKDGSMQVTYDGHPLYYYAPDDHQPGRATGQDLKQFGAEWYVLRPDGSAVEG